jgi:multiple sugar transport system ATP-binding protein
MIYVTHDQVEAMTMADKIVVLQAGRVEQVGSPLELYHHPANLFVAGFIGSPRMNLLPATLGGVEPGGIAVTLPSGARVVVPAEPGTVQAGRPVTLGIRPEALRPDPGGQLEGTVRLVERLGGLTLLHVGTGGDGALTVQTDGTDLTKAHEPVRLAVDAAGCHLFDEDGRALPHLVRHPLAS